MRPPSVAVLFTECGLRARYWQKQEEYPNVCSEKRGEATTVSMWKSPTSTLLVAQLVDPSGAHLDKPLLGALPVLGLRPALVQTAVNGHGKDLDHIQGQREEAVAYRFAGGRLDVDLLDRWRIGIKP